MFACALCIMVVAIALASGTIWLFNSFVSRDKEPASYWTGVGLWVVLALLFGGLSLPNS